MFRVHNFRQEIRVISGIAYIRATITSFVMISKLSIFITFATYVYLGNVITARKVFIVSSYIQLLNWSMVYFWPVALTEVAELYVSIKRVEKYLLQPEGKSRHQLLSGTKSAQCTKQIYSDQINTIASNIEQRANETRLRDPLHSIKGVHLKGLSASWNSTASDRCGIYNINLNITSSKLCAIVGQIGAGKSTLLNVLINELEPDLGIKSVNGSVSYASQESWLFEGSIRNNIIFVESFDEKRYRDVICVCALKRDLKLFPNGDQTIIGERGISLSGGQKARVNLARAIYKMADIYLLDDPLSAVDAHVGKHIFEKCLMEFLKDKIRILVTHQIQYLQDIEHVIVMNNGRIIAQDSYENLRTQITYLSLATPNDEKGNEKANKIEDPVVRVLNIY